MRRCLSCGHSNPDDNAFCGACGIRLEAAGLDARKVVTVIYCDLVGSTRLNETYDPEVLRPILHRYFEDVRAALERHGGRVEKYIGDAVAAVFGVPLSHEDDALRAVRAAFEIRARVDDIGRGGPIPISCRIGADTGEVLVSAGGEPLIGDAMNTAARLQAAAAPGEVVIGAATYELVRDAVIADQSIPLELKGKRKLVLAYRVREIHATATVGRARHPESPLVGREHEQRRLAEALERAVADASVQLFTLVGDPGIGKTRLVEEFMATAGAGATVVRGRCLSYGEGITFCAVAQTVPRLTMKVAATSAEAPAAEPKRSREVRRSPPGIKPGRRHLCPTAYRSDISRQGCAEGERRWGILLSLGRDLWYLPGGHATTRGLWVDPAHVLCPAIRATLSNASFPRICSFND